MQAAGKQLVEVWNLGLASKTVAMLCASESGMESDASRLYTP